MHPAEEWEIFEPARDDDYPRWKRWGFNALAFVLSLVFLALVVAALWALWIHLWVIPLIAVPLLAWAFISSVTHP